MDNRTETLEILLASTLVGVVRDGDARRARLITEALLEAGLRAVEITTTTPGCFEILADLARVAERAGAVLGAGTVRSAEHAAAARAAGAHFVVSPHTDPAVIAASLAQGLVSIPGAMTPTEIIAARSAGADVVKLFPISAVGGPKMLRLLRGPMPEVPCWVSGEVALEEIEAYVAAGASLVGLTGALTAELPDDVGAPIARRAARALELLARARDGGPLLTLAAGGRMGSVGLKELRRLPGSEHTPLEAVLPGRRGHAVRARLLLQSVGIPPSARVRIASEDGFAREIGAQSLYDGGFIHFATDGHPLGRAEGGPLRLFIVGGGDVCDNVKALSRIEAV